MPRPSASSLPNALGLVSCQGCDNQEGCGIARNAHISSLDKLITYNEQNVDDILHIQYCAKNDNDILHVQYCANNDDGLKVKS
jgi:hypothetical protein